MNNDWKSLTRGAGPAHAHHVSKSLWMALTVPTDSPGADRIVRSGQGAKAPLKLHLDGVGEVLGRGA